MFVSLNLFAAEYGVHKAGISQKSTHLQCRCNCLDHPGQQFPTCTGSLFAQEVYATAAGSDDMHI